MIFLTTVVLPEPVPPAMPITNISALIFRTRADGDKLQHIRDKITKISVELQKETEKMTQSAVEW